MRAAPPLVFIPNQLTELLQQLLRHRIMFRPSLFALGLGEKLPLSGVVSRPIHDLLVPMSVAPLMFLHERRYKDNPRLMQELLPPPSTTHRKNKKKLKTSCTATFSLHDFNNRDNILTMNNKNTHQSSKNTDTGSADHTPKDLRNHTMTENTADEIKGPRTLSRLEMAECKTGASILKNGQVCRMQPPIRRRVLGGPQADYCYHVMTRTVGAERILDAEDLEALRIIIRKMAKFSGVKVMTYCLLENHWHLLVRVPAKESFRHRFQDKRNKDGELLEAEGMGEVRLMNHLATLYSKAYMKQLQLELSDLRERGMAGDAEAFLEKYKRRFCDLSLFVKEIKERFSRWYNRKHQRVGTLWAGRFKSVLVEDGVALRTMAAYIDLNPVRAGIVDDPKDYRWSGYAEAVAGSRRARRGLCLVMNEPQDTWEDHKNQRTGKIDRGSGAWYRCWLMLDGKQVKADDGTQANHVKIRQGVPAEMAEEALKNQGVLPPKELLLTRTKYLSEGVAIGSQSFVAALFEKNRAFFGVTRKTGAKPLQSKDSDGGFKLYSLFGKSDKPAKSDHTESSGTSVFPEG